MRPIDGDVLADKLKQALHTARQHYEYEAEMELDAVLRDVEAMPTIEMPNWIPVSERLPEERKVYLVTYVTQTGRRYVRDCECSYAGSTPWHVDWSKKINGTVTAWMELPDPWEGRKE